MTPTHGAVLLPAVARSGDASNPFSAASPWPGLATAADQIGVALDADAVARFARYRELIQERNAQFNLTALRDPEAIERRLFLDALAMVPALDHAARRVACDPGRRVRLIDVGAGAGVPGLPLKIARPDLDVTLLDATGKKVAFLGEVIAELGLSDASAVHGRAEDLGQDSGFRETFDLATARAVARLPTLLEYVIPFLAVGGTALLPKGLQIDEELRGGRRAAAVLGARIVADDRLPVEGTRLVVAAKAKPTPAKFPRRTGMPSRTPLDEEP